MYAHRYWVTVPIQFISPYTESFARFNHTERCSYQEILFIAIALRLMLFARVARSQTLQCCKAQVSASSLMSEAQRSNSFPDSTIPCLRKSLTYNSSSKIEPLAELMFTTCKNFFTSYGQKYVLISALFLLQHGGTTSFRQYL